MKILFLGPPGAGKGTCAKLISKELGIPHISTGEIFRRMAEEGNLIGIEARDRYWNKGNLVPDDLTTRLVLERLGRDDCSKGYLLDGFPRTIPQAESLEKSFGTDLLLYLSAPEGVLIDRLLNRLTCKECHSIYNLITVRPKEGKKCDNCKSELYQREDDNKEKIINRSRNYSELTSPLADFYSGRELLRQIDSEKGLKEVLRQVKSEISSFLRVS